MIEPVYLVVLDASPEFGEEDGPWAADISIKSNGAERERSARWFVANDYRDVGPEESPFDSESVCFVSSNDSFVYVQKCDVKEIRNLHDEIIRQ